MKKKRETRARRPRAYTAPEAIKITATADLVQGSGVGGLDWMHYCQLDGVGC